MVTQPERAELAIGDYLPELAESGLPLYIYKRNARLSFDIVTEDRIKELASKVLQTWFEFPDLYHSILAYFGWKIVEHAGWKILSVKATWMCFQSLRRCIGIEEGVRHITTGHIDTWATEWFQDHPVCDPDSSISGTLSDITEILDMNDPSWESLKSLAEHWNPGNGTFLLFQVSSYT